MDAFDQLLGTFALSILIDWMTLFKLYLINYADGAHSDNFSSHVVKLKVQYKQRKIMIRYYLQNFIIPLHPQVSKLFFIDLVRIYSNGNLLP